MYILHVLMVYFLDLLLKDYLLVPQKEVVITNTIEIPQEKKFDKLVSVSVAGLLAHTIENIENDLPVSDVFTQYDC